MTKDEAVFWLKQIKEQYIKGGDEEFDCCRKEAIDMAIEALDEEYGEWISEMVEGEDWKGCKRHYYQPISCSKCHSPNHCKSIYCPKCGRKMKGAEE